MDFMKGELTNNKITAVTYGSAARALHWITAVFVVFMLASGACADLLSGELRQITMGLHKSFGVVVAALFFARVGVRLGCGAPPAPSSLSPLMRAAAGLTHGGLYLLLAAVPLSGLWMALAFGRPPEIFGLFDFPAIISKDRAVGVILKDWHAPLAYSFAAVIALHVGAALFHRFVKKDEVLGRMW